jgi:hypothetical protein
MSREELLQNPEVRALLEEHSARVARIVRTLIDTAVNVAEEQGHGENMVKELNTVMDRFYDERNSHPNYN